MEYIFLTTYYGLYLNHLMHIMFTNYKFLGMVFHRFISNKFFNYLSIKDITYYQNHHLYKSVFFLNRTIAINTHSFFSNDRMKMLSIITGNGTFFIVIMNYFKTICFLLNPFFPSNFLVHEIYKVKSNFETKFKHFKNVSKDISLIKERMYMRGLHYYRQMLKAPPVNPRVYISRTSKISPRDGS